MACSLSQYALLWTVWFDMAWTNGLLPWVDGGRRELQRELPNAVAPAWAGTKYRYRQTAATVPQDVNTRMIEFLLPFRNLNMISPFSEAQKWLDKLTNISLNLNVLPRQQEAGGSRWPTSTYSDNAESMASDTVHRRAYWHKDNAMSFHVSKNYI